MVARQAIQLIQRAPWLKKLLWRWWYQRIADGSRANWHFMNYGYATLDDREPPLQLQPADEPHRTASALYHCVARAVPLEGCDVLEVGSGRGVGASFLKRYHHPSTLTAVDFSTKAVAFCRQTHRIDGLSFVHGDAESLPFEDAAFDAVINVESSHCYGSMTAFLNEAVRVLRPGGHFLFADLRFAESRARLHEDLVATGMDIVEQQDITPNVLEALRQESATKQSEIEHSVGKGSGAFREFAAVEGSEIFESFRSGKLVYLRYALRK